MTSSVRRKQCVKNGSSEKSTTLKCTYSESTGEKYLPSAVDLKTRLVLLLIKSVIHIYDAVTFPLYFLLHQPWKKWKADKMIWAKQVREDDPYSPCVSVVETCHNPIRGISSMDELFRKCVLEHGIRKCVGVRERLDETEEYKDGKASKKVRLGEYKWYSYIDVEKRVENLTNALLELGLEPKQQIVIFAGTRFEWMLICQACFRINIPVATLYATLGEEGIIHGINETEVTHIFTSQELLPKVKKIIGKTPAVTNIVYMENINPADTTGFPERISIISFSQFENIGRTFKPILKPDPPTPDDLAVIMYTSGSTGIPKGVLLTHKNLVTSVSGLRDNVHILGTNDIYIGYLPLAHALEIAAECFCFAMGTRVGYSSPYTLTDKSSAIIPGCKGDATLLKPTIMCAVPLMLDRIRKGVNEMVNRNGPLGQEFFNFALQYKLAWYRRGFSTPILNRLVFKRIKDLVGGKVRLIACGGAPLSPDTQEFIRTCLDVYLVQAYAATETAAGATIMTVDDHSTGRVGAPLGNCSIRLVDWPEGKYHATDKPYPRGEIVVGGDCVALGYFKNEALTKECFKEEDDIRWFYTGDIGELHPNGTFKIVDRKKDLIKLQYGEYISLGKVEAELKTCPFVDNICVFGNGLHDYLVALVVPNAEQLKHLAIKMGKEEIPINDLCHDNSIASAVTKAVIDHGQKCKLMRTEIPRKLKLCTEYWQPETGLVTAAFKIKRKTIEQFYQKAIDEMYSPNLNGTNKSA